MEKVCHLLHELGIGRTYRGYYYLATAIHLVMEEEDRLLHIHKCLYQEIAFLYNTTPYCVERDIRTVKTHFWNSENRDRLDTITGFPIKQVPSNSEFITIISRYLQKENISILPTKKGHMDLNP